MSSLIAAFFAHFRRVSSSFAPQLKKLELELHCGREEIEMSLQGG